MNSPKRLISSLDIKRLRPNNISLRDMLSTLAKNKGIPHVKTITYKDEKIGRTSKIKLYKISDIRYALTSKIFYSRTELQKQFIELLEELEREQESHILVKEKIVI